MIVIPAIDLMNGGAVRLAEGDRDRVTRYDNPPAEFVLRFTNAGAKLIHIVDLDGAFAGEPTQLPVIAGLLDEAHKHGVRVEVGGGMRSGASVRRVLAAGADAVVIGTLAVREPETVRALCQEFPGQIVVAIDGREGKVSVDGWREDVELTSLELAKTAAQWGAAAVLYTDVARDGLQVGPAVSATAALQQEVSIPVYASGGVGALEDLSALAAAGIAGVVVGRALYEGTFTVEEALARC